MQPAIYNSLAELLSYPTDAHAWHAPIAPGDRRSSVAAELAAFMNVAGQMSLHELQELFIQTFDLSPVCSLEMGWHLFGENYDRGLLLVKMRQQMRAHGLVENAELPDHLTNGIRLLSRMEHQAAGYFAEAVVLPALEKMLEAIRGKQNAYEHVLDAVRLAIREDFPDLPSQLTVPARAPELTILV